MRPPRARGLLAAMNLLSASLTKPYDVGAGIATPDGTMCKLTKTDSAVLSLYLETQYVNEIAERGYAAPPNLDVPAAARPKLSRRGAKQARAGRLRRARRPDAPCARPSGGDVDSGPRDGSLSTGPSPPGVGVSRPSRGPVARVPAPVARFAGTRAAPPVDSGRMAPLRSA